MRTSTSPSHNSTRHWAKRGLASALALAGACGRPQPSPLTPGAEPELRVGLVAGAPGVTLGGDGELFVTDDANGEPIGSIPAGTVWTVVIDTPGVRLVKPDGSRSERRAGISAVSVTENRFAMANGRRYRGRLNVLRDPAGLTVMNRVPVESYLAGVIGGELGPRRADERHAMLAQAVVSSGRSGLHRAVSTASAVLANFGGIPLAFLFIATVGNAGLLTTWMSKTLGFSLKDDAGFSLYSITGVELVYLYFQIPLMVLVMTPALEGLRPQWREAAENLGASRWHYWRHVAGPVLAPSFLGSLLLLFCSSFSAYATADALVGGSVALVPNQIAAVLSGNVLEGQENLGAALALVMVVVVVPMTLIYQWLQRRTSKWLQ